MSDEQRPHTALKGAKVTGDIQELMSFTDANKTIGGYIEDQPPTGIVHAEREKLPRFSSTIQANKTSDEDVNLVTEHDDNSKVDEYNNDDTDDDDFFYGDYISANRITNNTKTQTPVVVQNVIDSKNSLTILKSEERSPSTRKPEVEIEIISDSSKSDESENEYHKEVSPHRDNSKRKLSGSETSLSDSPRKEPETTRISRAKRKHISTDSIKQQKTRRAADLEDDEDEQFFKELARESGRTTSTTKECSPPEVDRVFNIKFVSKIDGSDDKKVNAKVKGTHSFAQILPMALGLIMKEYNVSKGLRSHYEADAVSVYRKGVKILNFMTCNSLRVPIQGEKEVCDVSLFLVPKDQEKEHESTYEKSRHEDEVLSGLIETDASIRDFEDPNIEEYEKDLRKSASESVEIIDDESQSDEPGETVKIALMAKDNDKIYVNAHGDTTFAMLAQYYGERKGLSAKTNVTFIFDNEKLDSAHKVENVDLEDGDIIEVLLD